MYALFAQPADPTYFAGNYLELGAEQSEDYPIGVANGFERSSTVISKIEANIEEKKEEKNERKAGLLSFTQDCARKLQDLLTKHAPLDVPKALRDGLMFLSRDHDGTTLIPFGIDVQQDDANIYVRSGQLIER